MASNIDIEAKNDRQEGEQQAFNPRSVTRIESSYLASPITHSPARTPRGSFTASKRPTRPKVTEHQGDPAISSTASVQSIDIHNPDPDLVKVVGRHLVSEREGSPDSDKFASLKLQGGDVTRQIYNWQREHEGEDGKIKRGRSRSFTLGDDDEQGEASQIRVPGGFRREFITKKNSTNDDHAAEGSSVVDPESLNLQHIPMLTRNFIEFLSLYGHFAGEELGEESDEADSEQARESETSPLMGDDRAVPQRRPSTSVSKSKQKATVTETVLLLLKSFVGTGVLFLPRAFYNGGLLFSSVVLVAVSILSYWCFLLLIETKNHTGVGSFGDIGGVLFGPSARTQILSAIVLSQIGFASAYIVFVSQNMQAFVRNISTSGSVVSITTLIALQLIVFLPLSMIRNIAKLGSTALIADAFILLGLVYLYAWGGFTVLSEGVSDIAMFNSNDWTLFIGTAIFTFEGIGLIIPIQESMKEPKKFSSTLGGVMIGITVLFVSAGGLLYAACGSEVETVILLNLPRGSTAVNTIQLLYTLAILLSMPLQLFPAIRILENWMFVRSGKYSRKVKWQKNLFRFGLVFLTGLIAYIGASDLDKFVALTGSLACVPLVYIYPPLLHSKMVRTYSAMWFSDVAIVIVGVCMMVYTSFITLHSWIS